jgi:hypothetical protein
VTKVIRRNTDAPVSGGAIRTSVEVPVMGTEQRDGVVRSMTYVNFSKTEVKYGEA